MARQRTTAYSSSVSRRTGISHAAAKPQLTLDSLIWRVGTVQWNIVDSTVGQIPVTFVDPARDGLSEAWEERRRANNGSKIFERHLYGPGGLYDAKDMAGLPVGVQVVGRQWDEERMIEVMKVVDEALGPRGFAPGDFAKREAASRKVY